MDDTMTSSMIREAIIQGDRIKVQVEVQKAIAAGQSPLAIIGEVLNPSLREVGDRFGSGELFLPELIMAAEAMQSAMVILQPILEANKEKVKSPGRVVMATVQGDIHDIGKNIVCALLRANGFDVLDLGKDVAASEIISKAEEFNADVIGLSSLLSTTMPYCRDTLNLLEETDKKDKFVVFVGGGATSEDFARSIGAEFGGPHAEAGVERMRKAVEGRVVR